MAFDINNSADLLALKTYGNSLGLDGTQEILDQFNLPANNPTPTEGPDRLTAQKLLVAIFDISISSQDQFKVQLLFEGTNGLEGDMSAFRTQLANLSNAIDTAISLITRPLSWAEVTFGGLDENGTYESVSISRDDWIAARNS